MQLFGEEVGLKLIEIVYFPSYIVFKGSVDEKIVFGDDSDHASEFIRGEIVDFSSSDFKGAFFRFPFLAKLREISSEGVD